MAKVSFTANLLRHVHAPDMEVEAATLRAALDEVFAKLPQLRSYILDDQGHVRMHIAIFVDGVLVREKVDLSTAIAPASEIYVMQALSGG